MKTLLPYNLQLFAEDEDYILPDDYVETTPEEPTEVLETTETVEETTETEQVETIPPVETPVDSLEELEIKFLHEQKKLKDFSKDEIKTFLQKGMNHDRLLEQVNALKSDPRLCLIEDLAKESGMSADAYIKAIEETRKTSRIQAIAKEEECSIEVATKLYNAEVKEKKDQISSKAQREEEERQARVKKDQELFMSKFPDVKPEAIPNSVWEEVRDGVPLAQAYKNYITDQENTSLKDRLKVLEQQLINKQKAPVHGVTAHGSQEVAEDDDFLQGLLGQQ